ncbi:MAG: hypothetical protein ABII07_02590 [Patescibacteria group bacterium]|nr:hypothetical protein [Patescibacteria group bacterium]
MISLRSKLTQRLLLFFFLNPFERRHLNELANILEVNIQNLQKKLKELEKAGLFKSKNNYYSINCDWPLYCEYRDIIRKTIGAPVLIREALQHVRYLRDIRVDIKDYFDVTEEIRVQIPIDPEAYYRPSEKEIRRIFGRLRKDLGRKICLEFCVPGTGFAG